MKPSSVTVARWNDLVKEATPFTEDLDVQWFFRGHADNSKPLETTLERAAKRYGVELSELPAWEAGLIRRFKRQLYHYTTDVPQDLDYTEWLAVMQHFGAPTRLLDWTRSFYAACFFAIDRSSTEAAVWALNEDALGQAFKQKVPSELHYLVQPGENVRDHRKFKTAFRAKCPLRFVVPLNPYRLNQRLNIQQGVFLCPGDIAQPFEDNLQALLGPTPPRDILFKIVLSDDTTFRKELARRLHRMNMNAASLYPGLDGFARSLWDLLALPVRFYPADPELEDDL
jgi:hypothetical protein